MIFNLFVWLFFLTIAVSLQAKTYYYDNLNIPKIAANFVDLVSQRHNDTINYFVLSENILSGRISSAFVDLNVYTCLKFLGNTKMFEGPGFLFKEGKKNDIKFNKKTKQTTIQLSSSCLSKLGCVKYFIGLGLGLFPQVNRQDRDKYVKVFWKNIDKKNYGRFRKFSKGIVKRYSTEFDFGSLMNYDVMYLSRNGKKVYGSKHNSFNDNLIGQVQEFSYNDLRSINKYYCDKEVEGKIKCKNDGYYDYTVRRCICPYDYRDDDCSKLRIRSECGEQILTATGKLKSLNVEGRKTCVYDISAPKNKKIRISIKQVNTTKVDLCAPGSGLEVRYGKNKGTTGILLCGHYKKEIQLTSLSNEVSLVYYGRRYNFFNLTYKVVS
uniref:Metalloendopeptidase n=1 Tax=Parastrongyloides trichosuri TaxID=131310 RepID=A0A0N4ZJT1_PARTI